MEHHEWVSLNAPPQSEANVCSEMGLKRGGPTHDRGLS